MSDIKPCRICLRVGVKMLNYDEGLSLKFYYEEIMGPEITDMHELPQQFCYECAALLHKYHKFKEKCVYGQNILQDMLHKGPITLEALKNIRYIPHHIQTVPLIIQSVVDINIESTLITEEPADLKEITIAYNPIQKFEIDDDHSEHSISDDIINQGEHLFVEEKKVCITDENKTEIKIELIEEEMPMEKKIKSTEKIVKSTKKIVKSNEKIVKSRGKRKAKVKKEDKVKFKRTSDRRAATSVKYDELLSNDHWDICELSEEEAWRVFNAKAEDAKYLAAAFKCTDCRKGFSKQSMLDRHLQLKHIESRGRHECTFCHTRYRFECLLKSHMRQHYHKYKCLRCGLECDLRVTAVLHEEYHSGVTRKCLLCNKEFKHLSTYYTHLRTHKSEHVCTLCGVSFVSELGLRQHKRVKHIIADNDIPDEDETLNTYCKLCDKKFETREAFDKHLLQSALHADDNDNDDQPIAKQPFFDKLAPSRKTLGRRVRKMETKSKSESGKVNSTEKHMDKRRVKRRPNRVFKKPTTCNQCGEHFDTQAACMKHHAEKHPRTSFHSSNDRYICEICGSCLAPSSVPSHQNIHTKEILHKCNICERQFSASISLKRHQLTHTGEKPFACSLCDKRFTQSNSMKLHYRTYHLKQPYPKRNRWKKKEEEP